MDLNQLVNQLIVDSKGQLGGGFSVTPDSSLGVFVPELILCATICLMLVVRVAGSWGDALDKALLSFTRSASAFWIALLGAVAALVATAPWVALTGDVDIQRMEIFTGMLVYDSFSVFFRAVLLLFLVLFLIFTRLSGIPDREDGPDIYSLVFGATLGMCLMVTANHLLMVFMAVEMASVPSYVLAGMVKGRKRAGEAALKYSIYGAGAAGLMLYGISLLAGVLNSAHLPTMANELAVRLPSLYAEGGSTEQLMVLTVGGLMLMAGLAFKLSAFPFHFWCPDVFEGASAEVDAFLSVASKAAALALLIRVCLGLGTVPPEGVKPGERSAHVAVASVEAPSLAAGAMFAATDETPAKQAEPAGHEEAKAESHDAKADDAKADDTHKDKADTEHHAAAEGALTAMERLEPARSFIGKLVAFFAVLTCTFGNLAAYSQTNIKRLLAYSTIAHAGYMMMAIPAIMAAAGVDAAVAEKATASVGIYLVTYVFMNLGAFAVVAFLRNSMRSEEIDDYAGLLGRAPLMAICFALMLFSLVGLPPLAGFIGKFAVFGALADAYRLTSHSYLALVLVMGGVNTAISLYYYLRVVKVMTMSPEPEHRVPFQVSLFAAAFTLVLTIPTVGFIVGWNRLNEMALAAAQNLLF
ncbi:MAG: NADH-quinone oxidoreductase subunit N [Planctomycetales bacterium]|nr:NADH-quinone oxidoreductase subunit N [Planctomycetales bacterium]